jgi:hypothetical protein
MAAAARLPLIILVCGASVLALNMGVRQTFGLFLEPMTLDLGISRGNFSLAIAIQNIAAATSRSPSPYRTSFGAC